MLENENKKNSSPDINFNNDKKETSYINLGYAKMWWENLPTGHNMSGSPSKFSMLYRYLPIRNLSNVTDTEINFIYYKHFNLI